jgi:mono/diheme cytochrome c family protein
MTGNMKHPARVSWLRIGTVAFLLAGCQGQPSERSPIHLNPNMDDQEKSQAYEASEFFADGAVMRTPPLGTVAHGTLREDRVYFTGFNADSVAVAHSPITATMPILKRGQERFDIYCSPCHGRAGGGRGIMVNRGYPPPPTFHADRIRELPDGQVFAVISDGIRNMPAYRHQVPVDDRWAIVLYLRALQRSQDATLDDVPEEKRPLLD